LGWPFALLPTAWWFGVYVVSFCLTSHRTPTLHEALLWFVGWRGLRVRVILYHLYRCDHMRARHAKWGVKLILQHQQWASSLRTLLVQTGLAPPLV